MAKSNSKSMKQPLWIFGYGSIVWKVDFPMEESVFGYVKGYHRRFWQGSPDHRGVPGAVGRVVTLISSADSAQFHPHDSYLDPKQTTEPITWGRAYSIPANDVDDALKQLDHREKAGYAREYVDVYCQDGEIRECLVFIATPDNEDFLGPSSISEMAAQIATRAGPSGPNWEYLVNLAHSMREINVEDPHLFELEMEVNRIRQSTTD